jgi:hypothetical protein
LSNIPSNEIVDLLYIAKNDMSVQYQSFSFNHEKGEALVVFETEKDAEAF